MYFPDGGADLPFGLVVNPASALGRGQRVAARVARELDRAGVSVVLVSGRDAASGALAVGEAARRGLRGLILVGGDGLLGNVLQLAEARALPIGLVPAGSGNDFARTFALPHDPARAVRRILGAEASPRAVDLGVVEYSDPAQPGRRATRWFAGGLSIGFDAAINQRANDLRLPLGPVRYQLGLLAEIVTLHARPFRVQRGSEDRHFDGLLTTAMNIRTLGGGIPLAPDARTDDGLLDLVEVDAPSRLRVLSVLGVLARGKHGRLPEVRFTRVPSARIEAGGEVAYADGDRVGEGPFEVRAVRGGMRLLA